MLYENWTEFQDQKQEFILAYFFDAILSTYMTGMMHAFNKLDAVCKLYTACEQLMVADLFLIV